MKEIGSYVFYKCISLEEVKLPDSVEAIGSYAFGNCENLEKINYPLNWTKDIMDGTNIFKGCKKLKHIDVPEGVVAITHSAFYGSDYLESVSLPSTLKEIKNNAFQDCVALKEIVIPDGVEILGSDAFKGCESLKGIYFKGDAPNNVYEASSSFRSFDENVTLYYIKNREGWTTPTWKGYKTELWVPGINSSMNVDGVYAFKILDSETGDAIEGAVVSIDGNEIGTTNNEGKIGTFDDFSRVEISAYGYETREFSDYVKYESGIHCISLNKDPNMLSKATLIYNDKEYDVLDKNETLNRYYGDTKIDIIVECDSNPARYVLIQKNGDKVREMYECSNGEFTDIKIEEFENYQLIFVRTLDENDNILAETLIKIVVTEWKEFGNHSVSMLEGGLEFKVGEEIPIFGGNAVKISLPNLPIEYEVEGDKVKASINWSIMEYSNTNEDDDDGFKFFQGLKKDEFVKEIKKFAKKNQKEKTELLTSKKFNVETYIVGYAEGPIDSSELKGRLYVVVDLKTGVEHGFSFYGTPCVVEFEFEGKVSAGGEFILTEQKVVGAVNLELLAKINGYLGVGTKWVSAGVYGKGETELKFILATTDDVDAGLTEWNISAAFGIKGKFLGLKGEMDLWTGGPWMIYNRDTGELNSIKTDTYGINKINSLNDGLNALLKSPEKFEFIEYKPEKTSSILGSSITENEPDESGIKTIISNAYTGMEIDAVSLGDKVFVVYTDADSSRSKENQSKLMYSIYDAKEDSWSKAKAVADDGTADYSPMLYKDGNKVYILWQNAECLFNESDDIFSVSKKIGLGMAEFDIDTGKIKIYDYAFQNNGKYEAIPSFVVIDGTVYVTWCENSEDNPFGISGNNSIYYVKLNNGKWQKKEFIYSCGKPITSVDAGISNGTVAISFCEDYDADISTFDDVLIRTAFVEKSSGASETVYHGTNAKWAVIDGKEMLLWNKNGSIVGVSSVGKEKSVLKESFGIAGMDFEIIQNSEEAILVFTYSSSEREGTDIYASAYDSNLGSFCENVSVTSQNNYMEEVRVALAGNILFASGIQREVEAENGSWNEKANFVYATKEVASDMNITYAYVIENDSLIPGEKIKIEVTVKNNGTVRNDGFVVNVKNLAGNTVCSERVNTSVLSGEEVNFVIEAPLPEIPEKDVYTIGVGNSVFDVEIGSTKFTMLADVYSIGTRSFITVKVTNIGFAADSGKISVKDFENEHTEYISEEIPIIGYNESVSYEFEVMQDFFENERLKNLEIECIETTSSEIISCDFTLYSNCNIEYVQYTVCYDANGGYGAPSKQTKTEGKPLILCTDVPVREGYTFIGWATSADVTVAKYQPGDKYTEDADITLYAVWKEDIDMVYGDVDGNGKVNVLDANLIRRYAAKLIDMTADQLLAADVDGNGKVNVLDANLIRRYTAKLITEFPVEAQN